MIPKAYSNTPNLKRKNPYNGYNFVKKAETLVRKSIRNCPKPERKNKMKISDSPRDKIFHTFPKKNSQYPKFSEIEKPSSPIPKKSKHTTTKAEANEYGMQFVFNSVFSNNINTNKRPNTMNIDFRNRINSPNINNDNRTPNSSAHPQTLSFNKKKLKTRHFDIKPHIFLNPKKKIPNLHITNHQKIKQKNENVVNSRLNIYKKYELSLNLSKDKLDLTQDNVVPYQDKH